MRHLLSTADCHDEVSGSECDAVVYTRVTASVFAVLGCLFIIGMIVIHRTYHNYGQRLILNLTLASLFNTVPYFLGHQSEGPTCTFQAFTVTWGNWCVLAWVLCITHKLAINILYQRAGHDYEKWYHLFGWIPGFVLAAVPLFMNMYGPAGVWCWIEEDHKYATILRFGIWYVPLWIGISVLFVANFYIIRNVKRREKRWEGTYNPTMVAEKDFIVKQVTPIKYYPLVFTLCMMFPTVNRIQNATNPDSPIFGLLLLHSITSPLQGLINSLVYAYNTDKTVWQQCNPTGIKRALLFRKGSAVGEFKPNDINVSLQEEYNDSDSELEELVQ